MSNEELDSVEPHRAASGTQSSSSPTPSPGSGSPRSPLAEVTAQLTGTAISVLCALKASALVTCDESTPGPLGAPRWLWGLGALVLIAVPTSAHQARKLITALLAARNGSR